MALVGGVLNANTVLQPQFMQELLGYTATTAGMALTAGGIALVVVMPLAGWATGKISARTLAVCGFIMFTFTFRYAANVTSLQMSFSQSSWLRVIQMLPLPFCFISITNAAYVGMPKEESQPGLRPHQLRPQYRRKHPHRHHQRAGDQPLPVAPAASAGLHAAGRAGVPIASGRSSRASSAESSAAPTAAAWLWARSIASSICRRACRAIRMCTSSCRGCRSA